MLKYINNLKHKYWKRIATGFFATIMIFQAISSTMEVAAYEIGKVNLAPTTGKYYEQNLCSSNKTLNKEANKVKLSILQKEPEIYAEENDYDESQEITSKRTENSKTYKLSDGTYVTNTYFEPIHKKEGNEFVDIDNSLKNTSNNRSTPIYENKDGLYAFKVQDHIMSIENEDGVSLRFVNNDANLGVYSVKENVILYSEVYQNIDMEYRLGGNAVGTNFFINGTTDIKDISFTIEKADLHVQEVNDALLFLDKNDKIVFSYVKPSITDAKGIVHGVSFKFVERNDTVTVTLSLDEKWINNADRIYPLKLTTRAADENKDLSVNTSYNRSASPDITSNYYQLFVGYEDGSLSGGINFGISRTYIHVSGMNLGSDKEILSGKLKLYKVISEPNQWNTIAIGKTSGYVKPSDATWNKKPSVSNISTTNVRSDAGWQEFDVKSYIEDIYNGKNNTIELKATNESSVYTPNIFSSESGTGMPKISITYKDAFDVNPSLPIDTFDTEMRIFSILDKGFEAFSFDGIAKPDAQMVFELVERGKDNVIQTETSKGNINKYFIDPIYITNHIANTQDYKKDDINYTTNYIYKDRILKFDIPYEYKVKVKTSSSTSTKEFRTDSFIKYKVKSGDNLKNLASYYGVTIDEIKEDNNLKKNIIKEDDILLLRFKKNNDKVSKDVYTPPIRSVEYKAKYVNRGPRCSTGTCPIIDPVNAANGNYYYEGIDFVIKDANDFNFYRYYNSTGPQLSNMFGNGFTAPIESYISYDKNENMLYFTGDGKIFELQKTSTGFKARPQDHLEVSRKDELVTIKETDTENTYQFDVYGYLASMTSKEGVVTSLTYNGYGLVSLIKIGEKSLSFTYNENKLVKDITLPNSSKVIYKYDKNRNLIEFIDTKGNIKKYIYDKNNYLTSIIDKNGNTVTQNTYDSDGRVTKQIDGNGNMSTIQYENKKTTIANADGGKDVYTFNDAYDIVSITQDGTLTTQNTYDEYRNITSITDEDGIVIKYTYDKQNLLRADYEDGTFEEYKYDANNNIIYQRERDGNITVNTYSGNDLKSKKDSKNNSVSYVYDNKRRLIKETDQFGVSKSYTYAGNMISSIIYSNGLVEAFGYDANGNIVKESDNQGKITTYVYNANNEMTQKNYYDGTNEQWTYDKNGNIATYKDRIGGVTNNSYDRNNNLISSTKGNITSAKTYNENNLLVLETNEQGLATSYTYDLYGKKATETDAYGNTTKYMYDTEGNITKITDSFGNSEINEYQNGNLVKSTTKDGQITSYEYDSLKREIKKITPNGTIETKEYDGLLLKSETDTKGTIITHNYDKFNREIKTTAVYRDGVISTTENKYNEYGNVIETITDGASTKNIYDVYNQVISTTDALGQTSKKEYDFDGNIVKEIDALGNSVITIYDGNKNVISTTDKNGNKEIKSYNADGTLASETDALGFVKTYEYNNKGQVIEANDPYKNVVKYKYDNYGNQIEIILAGKIIEKKEYDSHGREIYTQTSKGRTSTVYDDFDRVIEKTNELTGLTSFTTYDEFGNVLKEKDSEGLTATYEYDKYNRKIKSTDAYGRIEKTVYNIRDKVVETSSYGGTKTSSVYDDRDNLVKNTDALGKVTKNTYNIANQLIKVEVGDRITENVYDANGNTIEVKNGNNNTSTKTVYDKNGNVIESIDALGNSIKNEYDAKNQVTVVIDAKGNHSKKEYDAYGNVVKEINTLGGTKQYKFNEYGLLETEVDERGFDINYEYNDNLLTSKITDSKGYTLTVEYNDKLQKIKETNANDGVTEYEYDVYGHVIKTIAPSEKETTKEYDALGNVIKEVSGRKTTITTYDKLGRLTKISINDVVQAENTYNDLNQLVETTDANKNESFFKYDTNGNIIYTNEKGSISEKEYDVYGNLIKQIDNKTYITENSYDANNRALVTKINGKATLTKEYDVNGNEIKTIEKGVEKRINYDALNRIQTVELPSATDATKFVVIQEVEYDTAGNAVRITDANGNVEERKFDANNNMIEEINKNGVKTLYEYDGMNNVIKVQNHEERYVTYIYDRSNNVINKKINNKYSEYEYDEDNNFISEEDENEYKTKYAYDAFGRKTEETKPDGTKIKFTYDNLGNKLTENGKTFTYDKRNNVLTSTNKEGTVKNTYDIFNNKTSVTDTRGDVVQYNFNNDKKLSEKEYGGIIVHYSYNENGQIDTIKKGKDIIARYEYNARNEIIKLTQEKTITLKSYDDMGRVLTQKSQKEGVSILDAAYSYDDNDNLIKEVIDGKGNTYTYDSYDELIESNKYINNKLIKSTYQHDVFGNKIESSSNEGKKIYKYNDRNQVESINTEKGIIKFSYDNNGNVSKKINEDGRVDLYKYDEFNELVQLDQDQYVFDYDYDAENERIKQVRTDTKDYHYDQWYNYSVPLEIVSNGEIKDTFKNLKEQTKKKQGNGNVCTSVLSDKYDVMYYKEPKVSEYTLDRNMEYTEVLKENETINIYGTTLLQSDNEDIITGWNGSVVAKIKNDDIKKISYSDYGVTNDITSGHGYNGEMLDNSGLIYLRARYYDPSVSRFVQIDNNYEGEKEIIASQNKYVYTINNPYKYVDKNGNWWLLDAIGDAIKSAVKTVKKVVKKAVRTDTNLFSPMVNTVRNFINTSVDFVKDVFNGDGANSTSKKGGGSQKKKPSYKKVRPIAKCPSNPIEYLPLTANQSITILSTTYNFGIARVTFKKAVNTNIKMNKSSAMKFTSVGLTSGGFNIKFSFDLSTLGTLASNFGISVGFGDWGAIKLSLSTSLGNVTLSLGARVETLKFWEDSSIIGSVTSRIYNKDGAKISIVDSAELRANALAVATVSIVFVKVGVPLLTGITAYIANFLETFPMILNGLKVTTIATTIAT